jgi:pimeloyl-ACP methyl ester carboxylesterase
VTKQLNERGLKDENLSIFGFFYGGAVGLYTALRRKNSCASVICHSDGYLGFSRMLSKPDTLMITITVFLDCRAKV